MIKKIIQYQRLLINLIYLGKPAKQGINNIWPLPIIIILSNFIGTTLFYGNSASSGSMMWIFLPSISVWLISNVVNGGERVFESVPFSRRFIVINIFTCLVVITLIDYIFSIIIATVFIGAIILIFTGNFNPKSVMQSPEAVVQVVDTAKADLLMLIILIIILFVGTMIVFIKNKKIRLSCFAGFYAVGYGLLYLLKTKMPIAPNSDKVEFLQSFSIMPEANIILNSLSIAMVLICVSSVFIAYRLYVSKSNVKTN